ncbi:MAG: T9SS type A sorting domain-containing protein [Bacteroidota bacterium]
MHFKKKSILFILCLLSQSLISQIDTITNFRGAEDGIPLLNSQELIEFNGQLIFRGFLMEEATLIKYDETQAEFIQLLDSANTMIIEPDDFILFDDFFVFAGMDINGEEGLYRSNGFSSGTYRIVPDRIFGIQCMTRIDDKIYFKGLRNGFQSELMISDGTAEGTKTLVDSSLMNFTFPCNFLAFKDHVYFSASTETSGFELFRSNGTSDSTFIVKDIFEGTGNGFTGSAFIFKDQIFLAANDGVQGNELWISDGTTEGTRLLKDINVGTSNSFPSLLNIIDNQFYFTANAQAYGIEIWRSDGTAEGTELFSDIRQGNIGSSPTYFESFGDGFIAYANARNEGFELHLVNAEGGASLIKDINAGRAGSSSFAFFNVNDLIYFDATDNVYGKELWVSDGTNAGTIMLSDLYSGPESSSPEILLFNEKGFYFSAILEGMGRELLFYNFNTNSLNGNRNSISLNVYPNPTSTYLNIESDNIFIKASIYDLSGRFINSFHTSKISIDNLPNGSYLIKIDFENQTVLKTFIKL